MLKLYVLLSPPAGHCAAARGGPKGGGTGPAAGQLPQKHGGLWQLPVVAVRRELRLAPFPCANRNWGRLPQPVTLLVRSFLLPTHPQAVACLVLVDLLLGILATFGGGGTHLMWYLGALTQLVAQMACGRVKMPGRGARECAGLALARGN